MPGFHTIQTEKLDITTTAVNIVNSELRNNFIEMKDIKNNISDNIKLISMNENILSEIKEARIGFELWRYLLYLTIILILLEMIISNANKKR